MMKKKNLKYMFTILIFMLVLMLNKSSYGKVLTDETIGLSPYVLNGRNGGTIYCVEQGVRFSGWSTFHVTGVYDVQDPVLAYIINMPDNEKRGNWGLTDIKQNMIWWYMNNYNTSSEATTIKNYAGRYQAWSSNWPAWNTLNVGDLSPYTTAANEYANKINNPKVKITNTSVAGGYLKVSIQASNIDYFDLSVNGTLYGSYDNNTNNISIPLTKFENQDNAILKVEGIVYVKKAKFQVLYNPYYQLQTLINTIADVESTKIVATDTLTVPVNTDVSLQKYITKVNGSPVSSRINRKADDSTTSNIYINSSGAVQGSSGKNKYDNIVSIEAGDYVTYRIDVYNNSNVNAYNVKITDTLPTSTGRYSIDGGTYKTITSKKIELPTISNLAARSSKGFDITVYFGKYETETLVNTAKIASTTPNNNTKYRTVDKDYVKMKEYKVSLEKFVNLLVKEDELNYYRENYVEIIKYLRQNNDKNVQDLLNKNNASYSNGRYNNYDLNQDGKVDEEDIELYNKLKDKIIDRSYIEEYIKNDINGDGIVDDKDLILYLSDINGDKEINKLDLYAYLLNGNIEENFFDAIKVYKILLNNNIQLENIDNIKNDIDQYIKSDINDDGINDENDNYTQESRIQTDEEGIEHTINFIKFNEVEYVIPDNNELIENIKNEDTNIDAYQKFILSDDIGNITISQLSEALQLFDVNNDTYLTKSDIDYIEQYSDLFTKISNIDNNTTLEVKNKNDSNIKYSINAELFFIYGIDTENETVVYNEKIDLNSDNKIDEEDSNLYHIYVKIKTLIDKRTEYNLNNEELNKYSEEYILNKAKETIEFLLNNLQLETISNEYINAIKVYRGFKRYNSNIEFNENNDLNKDGLINNQDLSLVINYINNKDKIAEALKSFINNNKEYETLSTYFTQLLNNKNACKVISENCKKITYNNLINNYIEDFDIYRLINEDTIKVKMNIDINNYDLNGDKEITQEDIDRIDMINIDILNNVRSNSLSTLITNNDINGDGVWDVNDDNLMTEIKKLTASSDENKLSNIENAISTNDTNTYEREGKAEHKYDDNVSTNNDWKSKNIVNVKNGDKVTYTIKVKNDGDTDVYITEITDYLPDGVEYGVRYDGGQYNQQTNNAVTFTNLEGILLKEGESASFNVTVTVTEPNMSINILQNTAEISKIKNKNNIEVKDSTPNNNKDSDYIQLKGIEPDPGPGPKPDPNTSAYIKGFVWNDIASNKTSDNYDGKYNNDNETKLGGIEVKLFRYGSSTNPVAITTTSTDDNEKGYYLFQDSTLTANKDKNVEEYVDFIKGSKTSGTKRWESYYSYYVEFEYDGVKYTSARDKNGNNIYKAVNSTDDKTNNYSKGSYSENGAWSNACEENYANTNGISRADFNKKFATIDQYGATSENGTRTTITYDPINEKDYIPQSIHQYNENMTMQSSTNLIRMADYNNLNTLSYTSLEHVNLGLRGRDIFDLELTSDVAKVDVTVNEQTGTYNFTNKVTIRRTDLYNENSGDNYYKYGDKNVPKEDAANVYQEGSEHIGEDQTQKIRTTDLDVSKAKSDTEYLKSKRPYDNDKQSISDIKVTYKITVQNTSRTQGTATKVIDYYDKDYSSPTATLYKQNGNKEVKVKDISIPDNAIDTSGTNYNSVELNVGEDIKLNQSESYYIYLTLTMNVNNLKNVFNNNDGKLNYPTFNMAEITEYKTQCASGQTEYTRGLIDKDSAPGSVATENVRLFPNTIGTSTTVQYYFGGNDLSKLKYEDDTYATPTLYFVADGSMRTITGTVFEDYTKLINNDANNKLISVKTGDGKQDKEYNIEPGIKGATVELYEINKEGKEVLRYTAKTNENGDFTFAGFLPGNYIIKYHYGDTNDTFLLDKAPNTKSYNGEDFQSTNNTGSYESNKLRYDDLVEDEKEFWYAYNKSEGISTATDLVEKRQQVSTKVTGFKDDQMTVLNNARDGKNANDAKVNDITVDSIRDATKMEAQTNSMLLTVEETVVNGSSTKQKNSFSDYTVSNMNFGIAEVPVTTIDLQKHVYSFKITDSTGKNTLAALERDLTNTAVTVNPSKIAENRLSVVIKVLSENLNLKAADVEELIDYNTRKNINENVSIKTGLNKEEKDKLQDAITDNSLAREIKIVQAWKVTSGNVLAAPGAEVLDVSIEDEKLQGAKLEATYEITATISAEKNFNNDAVTVPSIKGIVDYIDNNLSYNENSQTKEKINKDIWSIAKQSEVKFGEEGSPYGTRFGTLDPEGKLYNTILSIKSGSDLLLERCGTGTSYVTLEKVLSSNDTSIQDIIMNNVEIYEYKNSIEITSLNYNNQQETGNEFIYRDRVRTADRYIILAGRQHDSAISETITIHPPTGDSSINIIYYVIATISLVVIAVGVFGIKKFVLKK